MSFINFGYASGALRGAVSSMQTRDIGPPSIGNGMTSYPMGDIAQSQVAQLVLLGGVQDYIWGGHLWGTKKYKVAK